MRNCNICNCVFTATHTGFVQPGDVERYPNGLQTQAVSPWEAA